jgi:hypothetical protein
LQTGEIWLQVFVKGFTQRHEAAKETVSIG